MFSKKPTYTLQVALDYERLGRNQDEHNYFTDCDPVAGWVTLTLTEPQEIGKLYIRFYGTSKCSRKTPGSEGPSCRRVQPYLFNHDLSPKSINGFLDPGVHKWYFKTAFPRLTNAKLVQEKEERFNVSEEGFEHDAHPLPPTCNIKTGHTSGLDTHTHIWYAVDTEFTHIGGKPGKLKNLTTLQLDYVPMAKDSPVEPSVNTIHTSEVFECRSLGLIPDQHSASDPSEGLSWRDRINSKFYKDSTPLHTFRLELLALDQYTIDKAMPIWLRVEHNPDGQSSLSPNTYPAVYILESSIKFWTWNHIRGTTEWPFGNWKEGDVEDPVCYADQTYTYKAERNSKNNDDDPTNDVSAPPAIDTSTGMGTDLTKLLIPNGYTWGRTDVSVPDFATYNAQTKQAIEVNLQVMIGGKKYDLAYQRQKYKWEKWLDLKKVVCLQLKSGVTERQHKVGGEVMDDGDMMWYLLGESRDKYTFEPQCQWQKPVGKLSGGNGEK